MVDWLCNGRAGQPLESGPGSRAWTLSVGAGTVPRPESDVYIVAHRTGGPIVLFFPRTPSPALIYDLGPGVINCAVNGLSGQKHIMNYELLINKSVPKVNL